MPQKHKIKKVIDNWSEITKEDVFYLPLLGPVFISNELTKKILFDILDNSKTSKILPYDKDKYWFKKKKEKILFSEILIGKNYVLVPVKSFFKKRVLKFFYYSLKNLNSKSLKEIMFFLNNSEKFKNVDNYLLYSFLKPKVSQKFICQNIYLKIIKRTDVLEKNIKNLCFFNDLSLKIKKTLCSFGKESDLQGFNFLCQKIFINKRKFPLIICVILKNKIIGAIGPINILKDFLGNKWLMPPYFGVRKNFRNKKYGEKLWKTAMSFAGREGAKYTLLQSEDGSPSSKFYEKQGLKKLAEVYVLSFKK